MVLSYILSISLLGQGPALTILSKRRVSIKETSLSKVVRDVYKCGGRWDEVVYNVQVVGDSGKL